MGVMKRAGQHARWPLGDSAQRQSPGMGDQERQRLLSLTQWPWIPRAPPQGRCESVGPSVTPEGATSSVHRTQKRAV